MRNIVLIMHAGGIGQIIAFSYSMKAIINKTGQSIHFSKHLNVLFSIPS